MEKNAGPGGTWWENSYPGARVDVANHFYCYSFEPNNDWTHFFAEQHELQNYFTQVMAKHDLVEQVRWNTEVLAAEWDDNDGIWRVSLRSADGQTSTLRARAVITAVGQLNRPYIPELEGADTFEGPSFHSAAWDHSVGLTGKRVALVGAGASGFQIAPTIAEDVAHLTVFQRTAQWMFPNLMYHDEVGDGVRWAMRHLPFYGQVVPISPALARRRQRPRRRASRPGLHRSGLCRQRHQRRRADDVLPVDQQPGRRRPGLR